MKKNILFLITDDQRFDTIQALGNKEIQTPNLDQLVARGTSFTQAFIPGGTSGAVCMPSRGMIHTGRFLTELESQGESIPADHALLGECLIKNGYRSSGIGKWHNGTDSYRRSFTHGRTIFFGGMWDHWNVPINQYDVTGKYAQLKTFTQDPFSSNRTMTFPAETVSLGKHSTDLFSEEIIEEIEQLAKSDQPFFLYGSFLAPHDPRTMPQKYQKMYDPEKLSIPDNFLSEHPFDFDVRRERDETLEKYPRKKQAIQQHLADYYAMISHLDDRIGEIMDQLAECDILDETLIVFCGDNGLALGQHGLMGKQNLYDCSIRIPLILAGPEIPKNVRIEEKVFLMDVMPTLLSYTKTEIPATVTGKDLLPLIRQEEKGREELYLLFTDKIRGIVTEDYKYLDYRTDDGFEQQLFDRRKDSGENENLANQPGYEQIVELMKEKMLKHADRTGDFTFDQGISYWGKSPETSLNTPVLN